MTGLRVPPLIIHYTRIVNLLLLLPLLAVRLPEQLQKRAFPRELKKSPGRQMLAILKHLCHFPAPLTSYRSRRALPCHFFLFSPPPSFLSPLLFPLPNWIRCSDHYRSLIPRVVGLVDRRFLDKYFREFWKIRGVRIFRACTNVSIGLFNIISTVRRYIKSLFNVLIKFSSQSSGISRLLFTEIYINSISFSLDLVYIYIYLKRY